jgi:hypothetical protein
LPFATLATDDAQPDTTTNGRASALLNAPTSTIAARTSPISAEALVKQISINFVMNKIQTVAEI